MQVVAIYYLIYGEAVFFGEAVIYRYIPAPTAALYQYNVAPPQHYSGGSNIPFHRLLA